MNCGHVYGKLMPVGFFYVFARSSSMYSISKYNKSMWYIIFKLSMYDEISYHNV